jgi:hypothetical protein
MKLRTGSSINDFNPQSERLLPELHQKTLRELDDVTFQDLTCNTNFGEATGHVFIDRSSRGRRAIFMNASGADLDRVHRQRRPFHHKDVIPPRLECR